MNTRRFRWLLVLFLAAAGVTGATSYRAVPISAAGQEQAPPQGPGYVMSLPMLVADQPAADQPQAPPPDSGYVVLGWNNLGMHCYDPDFSSIAILPPYNTLVAQVVKVGDPPQIVTSGVTVEYGFPDNTWSVDRRGRPDKTNFWKYAEDLFGVSLPPNVGLTGKGLAGTMDQAGNTYVAEGIPLTNIRDRDAVTLKPYPFQKARITVKDAGNPKTVLAQLTVVAPVSTELMCQNCHADDMDATTKYAPDVQPTGKVETNILAIHDYLNGVLTDNYATFLAGREDLLDKTPLMDHQPVLCASCHGSNALGMPVVGNINNLSNAMHGHHNPDNAPDITPDTEGCYNCHPGPTTQCLRDTMSQNFALNCTDCHGDITVVAQNPDPWLNEPKCSGTGCHGAGYDTSLPLYRESQGHGGIFCEACHDSTHAIATSRESNDTIKFNELQGHPGTLSKCTVCHATQPTGMFHHAHQRG
jgi:hypothetical protein